MYTYMHVGLCMHSEKGKGKWIIYRSYKYMTSLQGGILDYSRIISSETQFFLGGHSRRLLSYIENLTLVGERLFLA